MRRILAELPAEDESTGINVDLGRFDRVDYVLVNGIPVKNYSMDGFMLTIPYSGIFANNLTVGVKNDDGSVAVQTYQLVYKAHEGYVAYRIYGTNDIGGLLMRPWRTFVKLMRLLFEKIGDLFKK